MYLIHYLVMDSIFTIAFFIQ